MRDAWQALEGMRWKIDTLDSLLAELLERRLALSLQIQALKEDHGLTAEDPEREREIASSLRSRPSEVADMIQAVIDRCKAAHRERRRAVAVSATSQPGTAGDSTRG